MKAISDDVEWSRYHTPSAGKKPCQIASLSLLSFDEKVAWDVLQRTGEHCLANPSKVKDAKTIRDDILKADGKMPVPKVKQEITNPGVLKSEAAAPSTPKEHTKRARVGTSPQFLDNEIPDMGFCDV